LTKRSTDVGNGMVRGRRTGVGVGAGPASAY
jgi:hypothetical protein